MSMNVARILRITSPGKIRLGRKYCPVCERSRTIIKLNDNEIAVRCMTCRASIVSMAIAEVISRECPRLEGLSVYELSTRGPLLGFLKRKCSDLTASRYVPGIKSGQYHDGELCQDVQNLSFDKNRFDLCTSTDVFEHVADDRAGFENICRVLKDSGKFIFTVPLYGDETIQRTRIHQDGTLEHLLPPEYHGDPLAKSGKILAYRNYGRDITVLLRESGFVDARIVKPELQDFWGFSRDVVVAGK